MFHSKFSEHVQNCLTSWLECKGKYTLVVSNIYFHEVIFTKLPGNFIFKKNILTSMKKDVVLNLQNTLKYSSKRVISYNVFSNWFERPLVCVSIILFAGSVLTRSWVNIYIRRKIFEKHRYYRLIILLLV